MIKLWFDQGVNNLMWQVFIIQHIINVSSLHVMLVWLSTAQCCLCAGSSTLVSLCFTWLFETFMFCEVVLVLTHNPQSKPLVRKSTWHVAFLINTVVFMMQRAVAFVWVNVKDGAVWQNEFLLLLYSCDALTKFDAQIRFIETSGVWKR